MDRLILFDIDHTLVKNAHGHKKAFSHAFKKVCGIDTTIDIINYHGMTDQQIILEVLMKLEMPEETVKAALPSIIREMVAFYLNYTEEAIEKLPGVEELLSKLYNKDYLLGLVTGNLEQIAKHKLNQVYLADMFEVGGYGSEHSERAELVKIAMRKAEGYYQFRCNHNIVLFGDAPQDMAAGSLARVKTIGVLTGIYDEPQLKQAGADRVVKNLENTANLMSLIADLTPLP